MRQTFFLLVLSILALARSSGADEPASRAALERLLSLAGDWAGTFEWSGGRTGGGSLSATYSTTGNGSAVVESLLMNGVPSMTSVYHLDGAELRMTHYCAAKNQPRLKAERIDLDEGVLDFRFVDATNLASPDAPHVEGLEMRLLGADRLSLTFLFTSGGAKSRERIDLQRVRKGQAPG